MSNGFREKSQQKFLFILLDIISLYNILHVNDLDYIVLHAKTQDKNWKSKIGFILQMIITVQNILNVNT